MNLEHPKCIKMPKFPNMRLKCPLCKSDSTKIVSNGQAARLCTNEKCSCEFSLKPFVFKSREQHASEVKTLLKSFYLDTLEKWSSKPLIYKPIRSNDGARMENDHKETAIRIIELWDAEPGTLEHQDLVCLSILVEGYENREDTS